MMNRRNFIKNIALAAGSTSPLLNALLNPAFASSPEFSNYKALVIVNLDGGNDAMNMFIPTEPSAHATYADIRGDLALSLTDLYSDEHYRVDANQHFTASTGTAQPYYHIDPNEPTSEGINRSLMYRKGSYHAGVNKLGINSLMPEFASLYNKGKLSLVSNVGTLVEPTSKAQIESGSANLPIFLFAHNHQERAVGTTQADILGSTGWAGRVADNWQLNGSVGLNISYAGLRRALIGASTSPLAMSTSKPSAYKNHAGVGTGAIEQILIDFANAPDQMNDYSRYYNVRNKATAELSTALVAAWENAPDFSTFAAKNSYNEALFTLYSNNHKEKLGMMTHHGLRDRFIQQLEATAKMIKLSKDEFQHKRQIFFVNGSSYDTHSKQIEGHSRNLRTVSLGISDFYKALEEMGLDEDVLIVSTSEFGRTLQSNGDGTDHGWGGHSFMLSGDSNFNGGNVFGDVMTDLSLTGANAYTDRARIIPTTSIEQMLAPALKWFGVDNNLMTTVLPNLSHFRTEVNEVESSFLQGVFS